MLFCFLYSSRDTIASIASSMTCVVPMEDKYIASSMTGSIVEILVQKTEDRWFSDVTL